jgi:hypothetical protein
MGIQTKIQDEIRKEMVSKIHGQPTSQDLTILEKEIIAILANVPTTLGGGNYGHVGIIMEPTKYSTMSGGINFANPLNQGFYPATLTATAAVGTRAKAEAEHKELINQYKIFEGVCLGTKDLILEAVENKYSSKLNMRHWDFSKHQDKC